MRWFTSDHHFGHENIIGFCDRPWGDVHSMDAGLIERHNKVVADTDEVYFIGDLAWNPRRDLPIAAYLNGQKFLVPGNHDRCHGMWAEAPSYRAMYEDAGFTILDPTIIMDIGGTDVTVCHFPYEPDAFDHSPRRAGSDKFSGNRPSDEGGWLICGHIHNNWLIHSRQINVGVDVWDWAPVSEESIGLIIRAGS